MKVFVVDLEPGMVITEDIKGANGRLLLPAGTTLNDQHLRIFKIWGVAEAEVSEKISRADSEIDEEILNMARKHSELLFRHVNMDTAPMGAFRKACIDKYAAELSKNGKQKAVPENNEDVPALPESAAFENARSFLSIQVKLGSFSDIYYKIKDALDNPSTTANTLADIISKDPGLSAKLISLVNSPLYGFSTPVESLSRAVSLVGTNGLSRLALSVSVMDSFKGLDNPHFSMADFWKHSLACAVFCRILSSQIPGTSQDKCFIIGMLHDLGRLIMIQNASAESKMAFSISRTHGLSTQESEQIVFGFDHCELASELFEEWNFPPSLAEAVAGHHGLKTGSPSIESAICSLGDSMAIALQYGSNGTGMVHPPYPGAWDALGLPTGAIATTALKAERQIKDILTLFGV